MLASPLRFPVAGLAGLVLLGLLAPAVSAQRGSMRRMGAVHPTFRMMGHVPHTMMTPRTTRVFASTHFTRQIHPLRRRNPFRLTPAVRRDLNQLRRLDPFGLPVVSPFANMNPYTQAPVASGGGYFDGGADVMNSLASVIDAQGQLLIAAEQAALDKQTKPDEPRNRRSVTDGPDERAHAPAAEQPRPEDRARNSSSVAEIASGRALNRLLDGLVRRPDQGAAGPNVPLDAQVLAHINLTASGNGAHLGLLKDGGALHWPSAFRALQPEERAEELRRHVDVLLAGAIDRAGRGGSDGALLQAVSGDVSSLSDLLKRNAATLESGSYLEARRFLGELEEAVKVLRQPDATRYLNGTYAARGLTVAELVRHMATQGLRFAPAVSGDEAAYVALHGALAVYSGPAHAETRRP